MGELTKLVWHDGVGWDVTRGADLLRHTPFDPALFAATPSTLCQGAAGLYRQLASAPDYLGWWADACGGDAPGVRRFAVETSADHWERPWEATIAALSEARWPDVAMLRLVPGRSAAVAPQDVGSPLRVLVIQGQEVAEELQGLDLAAEFAALAQARASLDAAALVIVSPLEVRSIGVADLVSALVEVKPTILWLSGHATEDPAGFLLADGTWLRPEALAASIQDAAKTSGVVPLYVVLWACKTGLNERFAAPRAAPPFIAALAAVGVSAVLATLGPLADDIAPEFAATVFGAIAAGRPLDHAVARARAELMAKQLPKAERDDWACPVVWCVDAPSEDIAWVGRGSPSATAKPRPAALFASIFSRLTSTKKGRGRRQSGHTTAASGLSIVQPALSRFDRNGSGACSGSRRSASRWSLHSIFAAALRVMSYAIGRVG